MAPTNEPRPLPARYIHRAWVAGASATATRLDGKDLPDQRIYEASAAAAVPAAGGKLTSRARSVAFDELLRVEEIESEALSVETELGKQSWIRCTASKIVLARRVEVDALTVMMKSSVTNTAREPHISAEGTAITGMRIDGRPVEVKLVDAEWMRRTATLDDLCSAFETDKDFHDRHAHQFFKAAKAPWNGTTPRVKGYIFCTLVESIACDHPEVTIDGNEIRLENFGRMWLAELMITVNSRRITGLRAQLGSPFKGMVTLGDGEPNGGTVP